MGITSEGNFSTFEKINKKGNTGETISAEVAISKLLHDKKIETRHSEVVQQIVSLRNAAVHDVLPSIPVEVQHHLMFYACKFYREVVEKHFKAHAADLNQSYLCLSFSELTTYADKVKKCVSSMKRNAAHKKLIWLLERGIAFDGNRYMSECQFDAKIRGKKRVFSYLEVGKFSNESDMVRIVPVEAPKNYTANVNLRKGSSKDSSLPVVVKRTEIEDDYPFLTRELGELIGKNTNFTAKAAVKLGLKGTDKYHQSIRSSKSGEIQRYSNAAKTILEKKLRSEPDFNPYR